MPQVSVIVLTYNPNPQALLQTLSAAAGQQGVDLEILVSDDGSAKKDFSGLPEFFESRGVRQYQILEHPENKGTVQNCLAAVTAARGEYVFLTSPGDLLFDENTLADLYRFAKKHNAKHCFGNSVFYYGGKQTRTVGKPLRPAAYAPGASASMGKAAFCSGDWIIGACYFRQREFAEECLRAVEKTAIYMEDTTSAAYAMAKNCLPLYFDRNIVWYEDGTGISTGTSELWKQRLDRDWGMTLQALVKQFPKDPWLDLLQRDHLQPVRWKRLARKLLRHPLICLQILRNKLTLQANEITCTPEDLGRLARLLEETV